MSINKRRILVLADWFSPGYKAGGPIRSCVNFSLHLQHDFDVLVLTSDRDLNASKPYVGIPQNEWTSFDSSIKVFYASPSWLSFSNISRLIRELQPDVLYLNSMYSRFFSIYPLLMKRMGRTNAKVILSPRGMLRQSAVQFKRRKKLFFLRLFKWLRVQQEVTFHCTDKTEVEDVKRYFGEVPVVLLSNLPSFQKPLVLPGGKKKNELKILFVGRIHPIKNLDFLLESLRHLQSFVQLTVIATREDEDYWRKCEQLISSLPQNVQINLKGEVPNEQVEEILRLNDIFALPTQGENFGHAIFEALSGGRPVVISDQTPWQGLSQWKAGWDLSLKDASRFTEVFKQFACMSQEELNEWCVGAWQYAHNYVEHSDLKNGYVELFGGKFKG